MKRAMHYAVGCEPFRGRALLFCLLMVLFIPAHGFCQGKEHILVLHSYNKGLTWTDSEDAGIESVLRTRRLKIDVHTEYMDTKLASDEEHYQGFYLLLKHKYASVAFRVVLCSDDDAYNFALKNRESLFPEAALVFCGVNYFKKLEDDRLRDVVTGVVEAFDIPTTLRTALRLHPHASKVIVINDGTTTGRANRKLLDELIPEFEKRVGFVFYDDLTMAELLDKVRLLSPKDVILLLTFNRDRAGKVFTYDESIAHIAKEAMAPIYGVWDFYLDKGIVGGMLTSGADQGRTAAEMALRILDGDKVRDIPVIRQSPNKYKFDYLQMTRFGITHDDLPPGSIVINKPVTFYESHTWLVLGGIAGFAGFTLIIILLLGYIRQRQHAVETLVESENRFRSLSDDALVGIYIIQDAFFTYINPKMVEIFGYEVEELVDKISPRELVLDEDWPKVRDNLQKRLSDEQHSIHYEFRGVRKDKAIVFLEVFGSRTVIQGKPAVIGTLLDISERKRGEQEVRELNTELRQKFVQLQEAQEDLVRKGKLAILGQLSGSVGHELRTPLGVMSNAVYLLKMILSNADVTVKEYLDIIKNEIDNSLRIITDLLDFARTKTPQTKAVTVRELTDENLGRCVIPDNIDIQTEIPDNLPLLRVDPLQMGQVLTNFITNAVQAMPDGGALRISARRLEPGLGNRDSGAGKQEAKNSSNLNSDFEVPNSETRVPSPEHEGFIAISVTDTGTGIAPENMKKLFQPLFTTKPKGIGLGLVVCKNLAEANGGKIEVENELGKRTTFSVILPVEVSRT